MSDEGWFIVAGLFATGGTVVLMGRYLWSLRNESDDDGEWWP